MDHSYSEFMGRLTANAETRFLPSGQQLTNFTMAHNSRYRDKDGNLKENSTFIPCKLFGARDEQFIAELTKGKNVLVTGEMRQSNWVDQATGQKRSALYLLVGKIVFRDVKKSSMDQNIPSEEVDHEEVTM